MLGHDAHLTDVEALHQLYCAVGAGIVPTAAWIGWALDLLLRDDDYAGDLASGTLTIRRALEKALWTRSPMANFSAHYARQDTHLHGVPVPAGSAILISHAAARPDCGAWPIQLQDPLPVIPVPLSGEAEPVPLDLQAALDVVYDDAAYADMLDYAHGTDPPLLPEQAAWVEGRRR